MNLNSTRPLPHKWLYTLGFRMFAKIASPVLGNHYPAEEIHTLAAQARQEFESLVPQIPDIGGKRPFSEFLLFTAISLAFYRANRLHGKNVEQTGIMIYEIGSSILKSTLSLLLRKLTPINFTQRYFHCLQRRALESLMRT